MKSLPPFTVRIKLVAIAIIATSTMMLSTSASWSAEVSSGIFNLEPVRRSQLASWLELDPLTESKQNIISVKKPFTVDTETPSLVKLPWPVSEAVEPSIASEATCTFANCLSLAHLNDVQEPALVAATEPQTHLPLAAPIPEIAQVADGNAADQTDLARASQNPIASLISVPFQNNTNFGVGDFDRTSNILNIQPVIPTPLSDGLILVNRTIIPIAYQPELASSLDSAFGLGDINYSGFFVPQTTGNFTWGIGPSIVLPTATDTVLGTGKWSMGPTVVGLVTEGPIVAGALVSQIWSFAGDRDREDISLLTVQPFFNYNFEGGWYATTSPVITANWLSNSEQWTVPIGGGAGRIFNIGRQPVNASLQAYWNAIKPEGAADWTLRAQLTLLFP